MPFSLCIVCGILMYKVKIPLFLPGMEGLAAGLNALRQWRRWKEGLNARKGEGCVVKGRGENVWNGGECEESTRLCEEREGESAGMSWECTERREKRAERMMLCGERQG